MNARKYLSLKKPCSDCPFVVANRFPLPTQRRQEIATDLRFGKTFSCHKTVEYTDDGPDTTNSSRCFGAASVLHKGGNAPMQGDQLAVRLGIAEIKGDLDRVDTFESLDAFTADGAHWDEEGKR